MSIAPEPILRAGMDRRAGLLFVRNQSLSEGAPMKMINDAMEAVHAITDMLIHWRAGTLETIRIHLGCFPAARWPGAPNLAAFFDQRFREYEKGERSR